MATETYPAESNGRVGELIHRITDDVKTIAKDQIELAKGEMQQTAKVAAAESAIVVLGGIVALIGFGLLCMSAVDALEGLIAPLWARLLIMAGVYLIVGGIIAGVFVKRLETDAIPDLTVPRYEAKRTLAGAKDTLQHS